MNWRDVRPREGFDYRIGVISQGVDNSLIMAVYATALRGLGLRADLVELDLDANDFDEAVQAIKDAGFRAAAVGNPHKVRAARIGEKFFMARESVGVANALLFEKEIYARNTEVTAFVNSIANIEPGKALVMGTGQVARSVCMGLFHAGWKVRSWNRNINKTRVLQTMFKRYGDIEPATMADPSGCRLVVNATPVGVKPGEQPPLQWNHVQPRTVVCDLVIRRVPTELLRAASLRGLKTIGGKQLMVEQAALAVEWWTGKEPPRDAMMESLQGR